MDALKIYIAKIASGRRLSREEAEEAFDIIMAGQATPAQMAGFLMILRTRGETIEEIIGAVASMRAKMLPVTAPYDAIDIVGTGGDQSGSYNVSTCSAFVVAGAGVPVAKHGNRALSSRAGAADTLTALGVNIDLKPPLITKCINGAGLGFMFAPMHHSAIHYVGPIRTELGTQTIFNLLGPLSNPAGVKRQLIGVFAREWIEPMAHVLKDLGSETVWIVHGNGLDEITISGTTHVVALENGMIRHFEITPESVGLRRVEPTELKGGDAMDNAIALRKILEGERGAHRDIVLLNAGAALVIAGKAVNIEQGIDLAAYSIDSGAANTVLKKLIAISNRLHFNQESL